MINRIEAKNISKQYNSKFTLSCSIEIGQGPLYAVAGPNGSGKSTLLRIIGLLEPPDNGKIFYHDRNSQFTNPYRNISLRRNVILVPTRPVLFDETVFDNAAYGLRLRKSDKQETKDRVMEVLNAVKIGNMAKRNAKELSSGEAQRLALARALVLDPDVLLLDEPTASLDLENTVIVEEIIQNQKAQEKIIILVTHNLNQAKGLSDVVIFMYGGSVAEVANTEIFFHSPESEMARKFVSGEIY